MLHRGASDHPDRRRGPIARRFGETWGTVLGVLRARGAIAIVAVVPVAALLFPLASSASAGASWPPHAWSVAASKVTIPVLAPKTLYGLALHGAIQTEDSASCSSVTATYVHGKDSLSILEMQPVCSNIGIHLTIGSVQVGTHRAILIGCDPQFSTQCNPKIALGLIWNFGTHHGQVQVLWHGITQAQGIAIARSMAVVPRSTLSYDEAVISQKNLGCIGLVGGCPFAVATTSDGHGHALYAIDLRWQAGDACGAWGIVYFFEGRTLVTTTQSLAPRAGVWGGSGPVKTVATGRFAVRYPVAPSANVPCSLYGSAGTDTYVYRWSGKTFVVASGMLPKLPKVLT